MVVAPPTSSEEGFSASVSRSPPTLGVYFSDENEV
jgi:hypothetical protein